MIPIELMVRWFAQVREGRHPIAEAIASQWFEEPVGVEPGRASSNIVCRVTRRDRVYALRCNFDSERTRDMYDSELRFVRFLGRAGPAADEVAWEGAGGGDSRREEEPSRAGDADAANPSEEPLRVALPVLSRNGALVETDDTEIGRLHAVMFEEAPGRAVPLDRMTVAELQTWGRTMAGLHARSSEFPRTGRPDWRDHMALAEDVIPRHETAAHVQITRVVDGLAGLEGTCKTRGLVHFDLEPDNLRWKNGTPTIFDFDDCAGYPLEADIAFALRDVFGDQAADWSPKHPSARTFLEGYGSVRTPEQAAMDALPLLIRAHNLVWFARILRALGTSSTENPAWALGLRERLQAKCDFLRSQFHGSRT